MKFKLITLFTYYALCALFKLVIGREQSVMVVGQLICNKKYFLDAEVEMWERDWFDPDDFLNKTENLEGGYFLLTGVNNEFFSISPYLKIKHRCDVQKEQNCYRISEFEVPASKIGDLYDMTYVSLNVRPQYDYEYCD